MSSDRRLAPVRVRVRPTPSADGGPPQVRLVADHASPAPRKRQPNVGSMKPGETRNPHGRPKGARGTKTMVRNIMGAKTTIRERGRQRKVTIFEALLLKELQLATEGDWRARKTILELGRWALTEEAQAPPGATPSADRSATDEAIIDWFVNEAGKLGGSSRGERGAS